MLRFTTAGSVDDGKVTLIGRLLHDTTSVYEDQLASIRDEPRQSLRRRAVDLSLLTDGLRAEREQGITIDVAYRYFSTAKRKFIIADTPGHEQYTRNMATGASTADVAIMLIDAKAFVKAGGLLPQSRRHTYIASLLRIPHIVAAVNKMDLVDYSEDVFDDGAQPVSRARSQAEASQRRTHSGERARRATTSSSRPPRCLGTRGQRFSNTSKPFLCRRLMQAPSRCAFPCSWCCVPMPSSAALQAGLSAASCASGRPFERSAERPNHAREQHRDLRRRTQRCPRSRRALPSLWKTRSISAAAKCWSTPRPKLPCKATPSAQCVVWMSEQPLVAGQTYLLKHTTRVVRATVRSIRHRVDVVTARASSELRTADE